MKDFELQLNRFYADRRGMFSVITDVIDDTNRNGYAQDVDFRANTGWGYSQNGTYVPLKQGDRNDQRRRQFNLVKEVTEQEVRDFYDTHAFHPEIGLDESVSRWKHITDYPFVLNPMSNPHRHRELNLMKAGYKPLAIVGQDEFNEYWRPTCQHLGWVHKHLKGEKFTVVHVAPREEAWRIDALACAQIVHRELTDKMVDFHSLVGRLLGYRLKDIAYWKGEPYDTY